LPPRTAGKRIIPALGDIIMFDTVISQSQQFLAGWGKLWQHQLERIDAASQEAARLQEEGAARTGEVIDELAKLGKASLDYASRLSAEWRHAGLEAFRRGAETITPAASDG
jgi:hypothetical protein